jgi:hypothetical protein
MKISIKSSAYLLLIMVLSLSQINCQEEDFDSIPICLTEIIQEISQYNLPGWAGIAAYRFQNRIVYYIDPGQYADDQAYDVVDSNCNLLGSLEGFVGNHIINGDDFYKEAKLIKVVWEK